MIESGYPAKLQYGDEIRVIAPATSLGVVSEENKKYALEKLESMGYRITFGKHVTELDLLSSSSVQSRVKDLHEAFADTNVKAILTVLGGYNSIQLLPHLDYELIRKNPKILCGFSDITALQNALYAKTGLVTYSGPHFSTFGMQKGLDYTAEYFQKCCAQEASFSVTSASTWSSDAWYLDQENRTFHPNEGWHVIQEGEVEGRVIGGNLGTLQALQGTPYMPALTDVVLFLEDVGNRSAEEFNRNLESLLQQQDLHNPKGLVIGRFEPESKMTFEKLKYIVQGKSQLQGLSVIANVDFGHTTPIITFPIGGMARICAKKGNSLIEIINH